MRIIARLDIKGTNVVKTVQSEGLRIVGDPVLMAKKYYNAGIDEIIYIDIVASLYQRNLDFEQLKNVSKQIFVPMTVGGGIRSVNDIAMALSAGADKVAINTFAIHHPDFLKDAAEKFGAQCIVLFAEAKKIGDRKWEAYTDGGREKTGMDIIKWIKKGINLGVGEVLLTSVDKDGTRLGYDLELIREVGSLSPVPVIAHGGAGKMLDAFDAKETGADAVSISSLFHYNLFSVGEVKKVMRDKGVVIRI